MGLRHGERSVICGTQVQHARLEEQLCAWLSKEATVLYSSCFDANGGVFEPLLDERDAVISDELNHASIIDGIRLCKARATGTATRDMTDLRAQLEAAAGARRRLVVTDGVFSTDGYLAPLADICDLAAEFGALVLVDDSHAIGVLGERGAGTPQLFGVQDRVAIVSGTLGKALGGASGGYIAAWSEVVDLLRQRSRPYLFSNAVAPPVVAGSLRALELTATGSDLRARRRANGDRFRTRMVEEGFDVRPDAHPIVPVMFGDPVLAGATAEALLARGDYVTAFSYPVVPRGEARIRVQLSAAHSDTDVQTAVRSFIEARAEVTGQR